MREQLAANVRSANSERGRIMDIVRSQSLRGIRDVIATSKTCSTGIRRGLAVSAVPIYDVRLLEDSGAFG